MWQNYKSTVLLLAGIIAGGFVGTLLPAASPYLAPVGHIFMNLMFVIIVPMIFFSVSTAVCRLRLHSALGRTLGMFFTIILIFLTFLCLMTYTAVLLFPPLSEGFEVTSSNTTVESRSIGELITDALTVGNFSNLFSVAHILPMMLFAILAGIAASMLKSDKIAKALEMGSALTTKMMDVLMVAAPIGLGCYFADMISQYSSTLLAGYGRMLGLYLILTVVVYLIVNPVVALLTGTRIKDWFRNILHPSLLSISTLSSSACIPANIQAATNLGADKEIAETAVPLGTQLFKQGSAVGCVMKTSLVLMLMGIDIMSSQQALLVLGIALVASVIVGAVPTGAGSAELFICSVLGADPQVLGLLLVFSTLIDMPGTLLNVNGNTLLPVLVKRINFKHQNKTS